ncbi:M61 family metallopeptidase [Sphingomonas sinipercae]|uniref:M61 family metallopeptidase n=1 Tax=Sphingomonas sinipercae TaxID=2714944 RepID=A0A6G7ZM93_9SPHN|nr:PDZ domain-containing protein [Sphingomonas sinipercae]QIL02117.1 M61 family metallopeptidase [Sphingomonas sinipercae]
MFRAFKYLAAASALALAATAEARVDYAIDLTAPEHHTGKVSIDFPATAGASLDIRMPAWRTGRYNILNLANGVRGFSASDRAGRPLRWKKIDKSTWRIHRAPGTPVRVGYEIYGNELGLRTRHIDDSHAYLNPSAIFMYADSLRSDDTTVSLRVPSGWTSVSGMQSPAPHRFIAANWDVLTDSPIETGISRRFAFKEGGRDYEVVFWGDGNYDARQTVADLQKIVAQAPKIWSAYPFQRYVFIVHATDGAGGATEHLNSTVIQIPRYAFWPRERYLGFLSTASHEFIHTWNVKAYRPSGLVPYDYQRENYSDLLWIAEGSTSYFADQQLLRAGIATPKEYFGHLDDIIDGHQRRGGAAVQSVADASFDQWIGQSGDRARNSEVDIYDQGEIVSWILDIALLERTGGRVSYRDVHDALYKRFPSTRRGYSSADVLQILQELTGSSWNDWWARYVNAPLGAVDFNSLLNPVGLKLTYSNAADPKPFAGWSGEQGSGGMKLTSVERGGPAWNAGFTPDDIIVAFDGKRVTNDRFGAALAERRPGATVTVTYFRRDQIGQKTLKLGASSGDASVGPIDNPTAAQKALFQRWLLVTYPGA